MRVSVKAVAVTFAAAAVAAMGVASPAEAHAFTSCSINPLHPSVSDAEVITCGEMDGIHRRAITTVQNRSDKTVELKSLLALVSFPQHADKECGPVRLAPGDRINCFTGWVTANFPVQQSKVFSIIYGSIDGQPFSHTSSHVAEPE